MAVDSLHERVGSVHERVDSLHERIDRLHVIRKPRTTFARSHSFCTFVSLHEHATTGRAAKEGQLWLRSSAVRDTFSCDAYLELRTVCGLAGQTEKLCQLHD